MDILKATVIGVIGALLCVILRRYKPEYAIAVAILTGAMLLIGATSYITDIFDITEKMIENAGIEKKYFSILVKAVGVAYVCEFASEICRDSGENAIATKLEMIGKLFILAMSIPIIKAFLEVCTDAINML